MATNNKTDRTTRQVADQKLIDGLNKHSSTFSSLVIGGQSYTTAAIIGLLQGRIATANAVTTTHATWEAAVLADQDERTKTKQFVSGLRQALKVAFAGSVEQLTDFGLKGPKAKPPRTPEQKAAAAAKAKATRAARHTMGPKQKAAIKGTVPATAPEAQPAAPAPTPPTPPVAPAAPPKS
jgi:hypothetical protein